MKHQKGLTLLELLVALSVFSIAALAILDTIFSTSRVVEDLEQKTLAHWVAGNALSDQLLLSQWPNVGTTRSEALMAGRDWYLVKKVETTARPDMRKITVEVRLDKDDETPIMSRIAFVGKWK